MQLGLNVPVFADPASLVALGVAAEANGWDGVFYWHHVVGTPDFPVPIHDPWPLLGALAVGTSRIRIGTAVTALPRHAPQEVARQAVTVDHLSGGRMTLGVGLGSPPSEYLALGRSADPHLLAGQADEALEVISGLWSGEPFTHHGEHQHLDQVQFLPTPLQQPRIPIWSSAIARNEHTLGRAERCDGVILGVMLDAGVGTLAPEMVAEVAGRPDAPADIVVLAPPGTDPAPYEAAGATWLVLAGWVDEMVEAAGRPPS